MSVTLAAEQCAVIPQASRINVIVSPRPTDTPTHVPRGGGVACMDRTMKIWRRTVSRSSDRACSVTCSRHRQSTTGRQGMRHSTAHGHGYVHTTDAGQKELANMRTRERPTGHPTQADKSTTYSRGVQTIRRCMRLQNNSQQPPEPWTASLEPVSRKHTHGLSPTPSCISTRSHRQRHRSRHRPHQQQDDHGLRRRRPQQRQHDRNVACGRHCSHPSPCHRRLLQSSCGAPQHDDNDSRRPLDDEGGRLCDRRQSRRHEHPQQPARPRVQAMRPVPLHRPHEQGGHRSVRGPGDASRLDRCPRAPPLLQRHPRWHRSYLQPTNSSPRHRACNGLVPSPPRNDVQRGEPRNLVRPTRCFPRHFVPTDAPPLALVSGADGGTQQSVSAGDEAQLADQHGSVLPTRRQRGGRVRQQHPREGQGPSE